MDDFFEVFKDLISGNDGEIDSAFVDDEVFTNVTDLNTDVIWNEENNNLFSQENSGSENIAMKGKKYGECHYCECRYYYSEARYDGMYLWTFQTFSYWNVTKDTRIPIGRVEYALL